MLASLALAREVWLCTLLVVPCQHLGHVAANEKVSLRNAGRRIFSEIFMLHCKHGSKRGLAHAHHNSEKKSMAIRQDKSSVGANGSLHISHGESALNPPMGRLPWKAPLAWHVKWTLILARRSVEKNPKLMTPTPCTQKFHVGANG